MHNWIDVRKVSSTKILPPLNENAKNVACLTRNSFELFKYNRLPVIKEEEGYGSENEGDLSVNFSGTLSFGKGDRSLLNQSNISNYQSNTRRGSLGSFKESSSITRLPPLCNINCLMNTDIKQNKPIWKTKFGKRFLNAKNDVEDLKPPVIKETRSNITPKTSIGKLKELHSHKPVLKRKSVRVRKDKNSGKDKKDLSDIYINRKKSNINNNIKNKQTSSKTTINSKKDSAEIQLPKSESKSIQFIETPPMEISSNITTNSSFSKNQRFLTECIQNILDNQFDEIVCEYCNERFSDVEDLCKHTEDHEKEKETCLLCEKVFFNPNDFVQHLLEHESVDRFSCKICKKYFPNLRKYKKHCLEYHYKATKEINNPDADSEIVMSKFQCKICKADFECEDEYEIHRKDHIRRNLIGAYLLCPKDMPAV